MSPKFLTYNKGSSYLLTNSLNQFQPDSLFANPILLFTFYKCHLSTF